jgi:hypothetical protein
MKRGCCCDYAVPVRQVVIAEAIAVAACWNGMSVNPRCSLKTSRVPGARAGSRLKMERSRGRRAGLEARRCEGQETDHRDEGAQRARSDVFHTR